MIKLRVGEGMNLGFTIQVDTLCHRIPNFINKAAEAGVRRVFIGLENINPDNLLAALLWFRLVSSYEGVHPLEGGALRLKFRRDRRPGLPRENPLAFYPRYAGETAVKAWRYWKVWREARAMLKEVPVAPDRATYADLAITPPEAEEYDTLDLYHATRGGEEALAKKRRTDALRAAV
jgi:hypothetical protein